MRFPARPMLARTIRLALFGAALSVGGGCAAGAREQWMAAHARVIPLQPACEPTVAYFAVTDDLAPRTSLGQATEPMVFAAAAGWPLETSR